MSNPRLVLFLGAGFSAGAGLPVMATLGDRIRRHSLLSADDLHDFNHIQIQCQQFGAIVDTSARNAEELASFLSILRITRPDFEFAGCKNHRTPDDAEALVLKAMSSVLHHPTTCRSSGVFNQVVDLVPKVDLTIVTTNYDLVCEMGAFSRGLALQPNPKLIPTLASSKPYADVQPLYFGRPPEVDPVQGAAVPIVKLHGSTNWALREDGIWACNTMSRQNRPGHQPEFVLEAIGDKERRVIVPPSVLKPLQQELVSSEWQRASVAMAEANEIWFVGYSFPESDSFMRYFIGASLVANPSITRIAVIDPDRTVCLDRAANIFSAPHYRDIFVPVPARWEDVQVTQLLESQWGNIIADHAIKKMKRTLEQESIMHGRLPGEPENAPPQPLRGRSRGLRNRGF